MSTRHRILFFRDGVVHCVHARDVPVGNTWFDAHPVGQTRLPEYLRDDKHPRHIQRAPVQMGERMSRRDAAVTKRYPELVRLATHPVEEVRNTDAWVLGQDTSTSAFDRSLADNAQSIRRHSVQRQRSPFSCPLRRWSTRRQQIVSLCNWRPITALISGRVARCRQSRGTVIHQARLILRSFRAIGGTARCAVARLADAATHLILAQTGGSVKSGAELATCGSRATDQVWE